MRPTVCYVAPYDPDYPRNVDIVRAFRAAGARVELVRGSGPVEGSSRGRARMLRTAFSGVVIALLRTVDVALRLLRCRVLVVGYFGQFDMLLLGMLARSMGKPLIFNPLVTLTDTLVEDRRLVSERSPLAAAIRWLDRTALRLADLVLVDTEENGEYVMQLAGIDASRLLVIPVGADEEVFYPSSAPGDAKDDEFDILYYGKFIPLHGVESIIRAAALVQRDRPEMRFELIGTGQEYALARRLADSLGVANIRWRDWLPYREIGERLREADVALGVFDGGDKAARVIPNKVHQALACGVPVVTRTSPAIDRLLENRTSALLVPPDDPDALAAALIDLARDATLRNGLGAAGRQAWEARASKERIAALAREALAQVGLQL